MSRAVPIRRPHSAAGSSYAFMAVAPRCVEMFPELNPELTEVCGDSATEKAPRRHLLGT